MFKINKKKEKKVNKIRMFCPQNFVFLIPTLSLFLVYKLFRKKGRKLLKMVDL